MKNIFKMFKSEPRDPRRDNPWYPANNPYANNYREPDYSLGCLIVVLCGIAFIFFLKLIKDFPYADFLDLCKQFWDAL